MSADPRLTRLQGQNGQSFSNTPTNTPPPPPPPPSKTPSDPSTSNEERPSSATPHTQSNGDAHSPQDSSDSFKLRFCTVCASNNNRSMEGHLRLSAANYPVISFGTGSLVRLPGPTMTQPNVYNFNTSSYTQMFSELEEKDPNLYRNNGILKMLDRNRNVKWGPERWQDWKIGEPRVAQTKTDRGSAGSEGGVVDVVITCEERCWDAVVDDLLNRGAPMNRPVHVFNVDIKDSHDEALIGGKAILDLANTLNQAAIEDREGAGVQAWENGGHARGTFDARVPELLAEWQERWPQFPSLWTLAWF